MTQTCLDSRKEKRIRFSWPFWFSYEDNGMIHRGQIVDLSSHAVSFSIPVHSCPQPGQHIQTRFSYPVNRNDLFHMNEYTHWSEVIRVDYTSFGTARVAVRLHQPLMNTHYDEDADKLEYATA